MQHIRSRDNPRFRHLCALASSSRERRDRGETVLDGAHLLAASLDAGVMPKSLWASEAALDDAEIRGLVARVPAERLHLLPDALLAQAAPTDTPSGVLAVIDIPALPAGQGSVVVLDGVQDAGNVGSILRSAAAAGAGQVWLTKGCAQAWSPRVLRAGMGAHFSIAMTESADALSLLDAWATQQAAPIAILATSLDARDSVFETDLCQPVVWLFGSEGAGVSPALLAKATRHLRIPMPGKTESLNVAAAAAVCLFEDVRQRGGR